MARSRLGVRTTFFGIPPALGISRFGGASTLPPTYQRVTRTVRIKQVLDPVTAQVHDSILLNDERFSILGVHGWAGLFFYLISRQFSTVTSCWRGYMCEYKAESNQLLWNTLRVNHEQHGPLINSVLPCFGKETCNNVYNHLDLPVDLSGEIRAGDQFIPELYVHMRF